MIGPSIKLIHDFKHDFGCLTLKKNLKEGNASCISGQNLAVAGANLTMALS